VTHQPRLVASRRVVVGGGATPYEIVPACLELREGAIAAVHRLSEEGYRDRCPELAVQRSAMLVDYGDKLISPAFINAHTHLALGVLRGIDLRAIGRGNMVEDFFFEVEKLLSPADIRAFVRMGAYESMLQGVGLVWDHYYAGEQVAEGLHDVGLCGVVAPTLQDLAGPGKDSWEAELETTVRLAESERFARAGVFAAVGPHATDTVSESLFGRALTLSEEHGLPLHAHLAQSIEEYRRAHERHGVSPVRWLERIGALSRCRGVWAHGIYASRADMALLDWRRHALVFCPYSQLVFGFPAAVDMWSEQGARWVVATDCASSNDSMNVQKELRMVAAQRSIGASWSPAYRRFVAGDELSDAEAAWASRSAAYDAHASFGDPKQLLDRVWAIPGELHPAFTAGVIAEGALANLVVWDTEHPSMWPAFDPLHVLCMADTAGAIHAMYVAGQQQGTDGAFAASIAASDTFRAAQVEARARLERIADKLGAAVQRRSSQQPPFGGNSD
jgi:5-methylthioadenosine/S-adenosylhomocysteine deaminase